MPIPLIPVVPPPPTTPTTPTTPTSPTSPGGPTGAPVTQVIRRALALTGANGDTINFGLGDYIAEPGWRGFDLPPMQVQRRTGAGQGSRWLSTRREERLLDIPVFVRGVDVATFRSRLTRLMAILDDRFGPTRITVHDGFGGSRSLDAHYLSGAEGEWVPGRSGPTYQRMALAFVAPWPFWRSDASVQGAVGTGQGGEAFIPFGPPIGTSPSQVLGEMQVTNPGDADAYPVWTLRGPGGPATLRSVTDNAELTLNTTLAAGAIRVIDTAERTIVDADGVSRYSELGAAPRFWSLPPGETTVEITMTGATADSSISFEYQPQWMTAT